MIFRFKVKLRGKKLKNMRDLIEAQTHWGKATSLMDSQETVGGFFG